MLNAQPMKMSRIPCLTASPSHHGPQTDDICGHKTTYTEYDLPLSSQKHFTIDPNGLLKDEWRFNFVDRSGKRQNFKFNRNFSSKEGKLTTHAVWIVSDVLHKIVTNKSDSIRQNLPSDQGRRRRADRRAQRLVPTSEG
jgi:hypothetical protein